MEHNQAKNNFCYSQQHSIAQEWATSQTKQWGRKARYNSNTPTTTHLSFKNMAPGQKEGHGCFWWVDEEKDEERVENTLGTCI